MPRQPQSRKNAILFFSSGDATRSQMAEGFFRAWSNSQFEPVSTAVRAADINPRAVEVMRELGIDISTQKSRTIKDSFKRHFVCVVAMCEIPRERCPIWPFTRAIFTWNIHDPASPNGTAAHTLENLRRSRDEIAANMKEFIAQTLPTFQPPSAMAAGR
jgi:arsenate reductase